MRKNRKVSKRKSRIATYAAYFAVVLLTFFVMMVLNIMANTKCSQLQKSIADKEKILSLGEDELERNEIRWDAVKSSDNLEHALVKRGMAMYYPNPNQIVRMDEAGMVLPSQTSVALLRRKKQDRSTASYGGAGDRRAVRRVMR